MEKRYHDEAVVCRQRWLISCFLRLLYLYFFTEEIWGGVSILFFFLYICQNPFKNEVIHLMVRLWRRLCKNILSPRASIASQLWPECGYMCIFDVLNVAAAALCILLVDSFSLCVVVHKALLPLKTSSRRECARGVHSQYVVVQLISRFAYFSFGFDTFYHPDCNNPFTEQCRNIQNQMLKLWLLVAKVLSGYAEEVLSYYRNCSLFYL